MNTCGLDLPRPSRAAPLAAGAAVAAVLVSTGLLSPSLGLTLAVVFATAGGTSALVAHQRLAALRRQTDRELRRPSRPDPDPLTDWRTAELTAPRRRVARARSLQHTVRALSPTRLPGTSPLNRVAVRPHARLLLQLADRITALEQPVTPYGMLLVEDLLTSPDSPLHAPERAAEIGLAIHACLDALAGSPHQFGLRIAS